MEWMRLVMRDAQSPEDSRIYSMIPSNLENKKKRVVVKDIEDKKGKRMGDYVEEFDYLISSGISLGGEGYQQAEFPADRVQ